MSTPRPAALSSSSPRRQAAGSSQARLKRRTGAQSNRLSVPTNLLLHPLRSVRLAWPGLAFPPFPPSFPLLCPYRPRCVLHQTRRSPLSKTAPYSMCARLLPTAAPARRASSLPCIHTPRSPPARARSPPPSPLKGGLAAEPNGLTLRSGPQ